MTAEDEGLEPEAQVDEALGEEEDEDSDFAEYAASVEKAVDASDATDAREVAVLTKEDAELEAFAVDAVIARGAWDELPIDVVNSLDAERFDQYTAWRDTQARDGDVDDEVEPEPALGSYLEPAVPGIRYHEMSQADFDKLVAELSAGS